MFIFFSKFLPLLMYPTGIVFLLLVLSLLLNANKKVQRIVLVSALLILFIGGNRWTTAALIRSLEQKTPVNELPVADAIVVLGGGTEPFQSPRQMVELNSAGDRVIYAGKLWKDGKAPIILASGGAIDWMGNRGMTPAEESLEILKLMGIPEEKIILQNQSITTYDESILDVAILEKKGVRSILLVTTAMHMPRARALFERHAISVIPAPTDYKITDSYWEDLKRPTLEILLIGLIPSGDDLGLFAAGLKEYLGLWVYQFRGWL